MSQDPKDASPAPSRESQLLAESLGFRVGASHTFTVEEMAAMGIVANPNARPAPVVRVLAIDYEKKIVTLG